MTPCVTIELLIHTVHTIFRGRSGDTTWRQFKNYITIIWPWKVMHFVISNLVVVNCSKFVLRSKDWGQASKALYDTRTLSRIRMEWGTREVGMARGYNRSNDGLECSLHLESLTRVCVVGVWSETEGNPPSEESLDKWTRPSGYSSLTEWRRGGWILDILEGWDKRTVDAAIRAAKVQMPYTYLEEAPSGGLHWLGT